MKKIFAATLAAVMTVSLTSVAFAETEMGFVLGYNELGSGTGDGTLVYADLDDDGSYEKYSSLSALASAASSNGGVLEAGVKEEIDRHGLKLLGVLPQDDGVYRCDCNGEPSAKLPDDSPMKAAVGRLMENLGL